MPLTEYLNHPLYWVITGVIIYATLERLHGNRIRQLVERHYETVAVWTAIALVIIDISVIVAFTILVLLIPFLHLNLSMMIIIPIGVVLYFWGMLLSRYLWKLIIQICSNEQNNAEIVEGA